MKNNPYAEFDALTASWMTPECKSWLIENGFFKMPASVNHHGNVEGGLFAHSLEVTQWLIEMTAKLPLQWQLQRSPVLVGLFHDLCKIDNYVKVIDVPGKVIMGSGEVKGEEAHFEYNPSKILDGHGDKSVMLLSQFFTLTEEEILCIRFHMGAYEKDDWSAYDLAIRKYPNVLWTHSADMAASKISDI